MGMADMGLNGARLIVKGCEQRSAGVLQKTDEINNSLMKLFLQINCLLVRKRHEHRVRSVRKDFSLS